MVVLIVLLVSWLSFRAAGAFGVSAFAAWSSSARCALALDVRIHSQRPLHEDEVRLGTHGAACFSTSACCDLHNRRAGIPGCRGTVASAIPAAADFA